MAQDMARHGVIRPEQVARHPLRRMVTNVVGGNRPGVQVEVHKLQLETDDVLLLATDGLTRMVPDDQIAEVLQAERDPQAACESLVSRALQRGGRDNVTVIVGRYEHC